jgi:hypothetical protein
MHPCLEESLEIMRIVKQQGREIIHIGMMIAENKNHTDFSTFLKDSNISEDKYKKLLTNSFSFQTFNKGIQKQPQMQFILSFDRYLDKVLLTTNIVGSAKKEIETFREYQKAKEKEDER